MYLKIEKNSTLNDYIPTRMFSKVQNYSPCCLFVTIILQNMRFKKHCLIQSFSEDSTRRTRLWPANSCLGMLF